jgi:predicted AlkP superfamily phosphohydrolase/phosphomutase
MILEAALMTVPDVNRPNTRVLFIGLDAADAELIEQWCQEGLLPNISRMKASGTWARMRTTAEIVHVSAWPSIFTGTTPDKHGLYHAYVTKPGHQGPMRPRPDQVPFPFLWKLLSDQNRRCVIMDAFMTCPLQHFNGTQIVEWGTWSWFWKPTMSPRSLKKEIQEKFGSYPAEDHSKVLTLPDSQGFRQRLLAAVTKKTQVVKWLMDREAWDLFLVVFGEAHPAGHYFWHLHDPSYIAHPEGGAGALRHALRDVYVAIDSAVGEILKGVDDRTTVFLVSGDGMGPNYSGSHILGDLLTRMGLLKMGTAHGGQSDDKPQSATKSGKARTDYLHTMRKLIPAGWRIAISKALLSHEMKEKLSLRWLTAGVEWHRTRAFLLSNANEGFIRINLKGREPQGIVEPGKEYEELCEELYQTAKSMLNPINGQPAVRTVYKSDDIYQGCCRSHMPDIIVNWNLDAALTTQLHAEGYGLVQSDKPPCAISPYYTGNHRPNAFMAVVGPEICRGETLDGSNVLDLAPTILSLLGVEPPDHMDGRVLSELHGLRTAEGLPSGRAG